MNTLQIVIYGLCGVTIAGGMLILVMSWMKAAARGDRLMRGKIHKH